MLTSNDIQIGGQVVTLDGCKETQSNGTSETPRIFVVYASATIIERASFPLEAIEAEKDKRLKVAMTLANSVWSKIYGELHLFLASTQVLKKHWPIPEPLLVDHLKRLQDLERRYIAAKMSTPMEPPSSNLPPSIIRGE